MNGGRILKDYRYRRWSYRRERASVFVYWLGRAAFSSPKQELIKVGTTPQNF